MAPGKLFLSPNSRTTQALISWQDHHVRIARWYFRTCHVICCPYHWLRWWHWGGHAWSYHCACCCNYHWSLYHHIISFVFYCSVWWWRWSSVSWRKSEVLRLRLHCPIRRCARNDAHCWRNGLFAFLSVSGNAWRLDNPKTVSVAVGWLRFLNWLCRLNLWRFFFSQIWWSGRRHSNDLWNLIKVSGGSWVSWTGLNSIFWRWFCGWPIVDVKLESRILFWFFNFWWCCRSVLLSLNLILLSLDFILLSDHWDGWLLSHWGFFRSFHNFWLDLYWFNWFWLGFDFRFDLNFYFRLYLGLDFRLGDNFRFHKNLSFGLDWLNWKTWDESVWLLLCLAHSLNYSIGKRLWIDLSFCLIFRWIILLVISGFRLWLIIECQVINWHGFSSVGKIVVVLSLLGLHNIGFRNFW